jgi:hypothetical protein
MSTIKNAIFQLEGEDLNLVNSIRRKYIDTGLTYGWKSNGRKDYDQGHWNKMLIRNSRRMPCDHSKSPYLSNHPEVKQIWDIIQSIIGNRGLYRAYVNGYTYGTDGYAHQDDSWIFKKYGEKALSETSIVYLNPTWNVDWGGETVVYENLDHEDNEIMASVLPKLGKVFVFESKQLHASRPLSRLCKELRSVLVIKTIDPELIVSPHMDFIMKLSSGIDHSGRSFFEHLFGTMLNLEDMRASDEVLLAGLYHSVYGTESFKYNTPDITRDLIKNTIGHYPEYLVYEFCSMKNRINTLLNNTNEYDDKILSDLISIEICNILDQNGNTNSNIVIALKARLKELKKV